MEDLTPEIKTYSTSIPSSTPNSPSFHFHLTHLSSTLFIWVGAGKSTPPTTTSDNSDMDSGLSLEERRLGQDWSVAMPSRGHIPVTSTAIFRSGSGDISLAMSQRIVRKLPPNQIHLSLSLPTSLTSSGPNADPTAARSLLIMEKQLVKWLEEVLSKVEGNPLG